MLFLRFIEVEERQLVRLLGSGSRLGFVFGDCTAVFDYERFELKFPEYFHKGFRVGFVALKFFCVEVDWCIGDNGHEMFRHAYLFCVIAYFCLERTLYLLSVFKHVLDGTKL